LTAASVDGFNVDLLDIYVDGLKPDRLKSTKAIAISVPLFDSLIK
jgi:hypothetical protein